MSEIRSLATAVGYRRSCFALDLPRSTFYSWCLSKVKPERAKTRPPNALSDAERRYVLDILNATEYCDLSPTEIYAKLLDKGIYLCSISTMYRLIKAQGGTLDRRNPRKHPKRSVPRLMANGPNQVWTWDITKLKPLRKGAAYIFLYLVQDLFSRYVVGWTVADREGADIGINLVATVMTREKVKPKTVTLHSDNGAPMKCRSWINLENDLGVSRSFSRPRVSDDNPYVESLFKTVKNHPQMPAGFSSVIDARGYLKPYFEWYNHEHHHKGIALLTPNDVYSGIAQSKLDVYNEAKRIAYNANPERYSHPPKLVALPKEAFRSIRREYYQSPYSEL